MIKGNVIVGQSGGPTSVINSSIAGVYCAAKECGAAHVYGMVHGIQGFLEEQYIDMSDYLKNDLDVELLKRTPAAFLGSCRYKLPKIEDAKEVYDKIFEIIDKLEIEVFIYTGGNDSMDTIKNLSDYAEKIGYTKTRFMGCPKTIDNDLALTDHTPGYGSAAKYIAASMKEVIRDATCMDLAKGQVTVVEIMGRDAGWLTAAAALCKGEDCPGPDMIYLPEVDFDLKDFTERVKALLKEKSSVVVAVSEGIHDAEGTYICEYGASSATVDAFGHKQLTGTATYLAPYLAGEIGCKARAIEFSILQRAAAHCASLADVEEAFAAGEATVRAADEGKTGMMIAFERISQNPYLCGTTPKDVHQIANVVRSVPREWINEEGTYVTDEFVEFAKPLIMGEVPQIYVDGLPRHIVAPKELYQSK